MGPAALTAVFSFNTYFKSLIIATGELNINKK